MQADQPTPTVSTVWREAAEVIARHALFRLDDGTTWDSLPAEVQERMRSRYAGDAAAVVAEVRPLIEAEVRQQVAEEIRSEMNECDACPDHSVETFKLCVDIARGDQP